MTAELQLWWGVGYCVFMLLLALLFRWKIPKKINHVYGYRTHRSMRNELVWKASNRFAAHFFVKICLLCFLVPPIVYFIFPEYGLLISITIYTLFVVSILFYTEKYIDENFDGDGNPK